MEDLRDEVAVRREASRRRAASKSETASAAAKDEPASASTEGAKSTSPDADARSAPTAGAGATGAKRAEAEDWGFGEAEAGADKPAAPKKAPPSRRRLRRRRPATRPGGRGPLAQRWHGVPLIVRQRIAAGVIFVALVLIVWLVLVPVAPCSFPGGDECAPEDDAIALVPGDAALYAHANLDPATEQFENADAIREKLPVLSSQLLDLVPALDKGVDYSKDIQPWSSGEIGVVLEPASPAALITSGGGGEGKGGKDGNGGGGKGGNDEKGGKDEKGKGGSESPFEQALLIESKDSEQAKQFASSLQSGTVDDTEVDGIAVAVDEDDLASAMVKGFLVIGDQPVVADVIAASSDGRSLDSQEAVSSLRDELPDDRLADFYVGGDAVRAAFDAERDLGQLESLIDPEATDGVAGAITAGEGGDSIGLDLRSAIDPDRADASPPVVADFPNFEPTLTGEASADALAYIGLGNPSDSLDALLERAKADQPSLTKQLERFDEQLGKKAGVDLRQDLIPLLDSEVALSVSPAPAASTEGTTPGVTESVGVPSATLVVDDVDEEKAKPALARLQVPLAKALDPGEEQKATFEAIELEGGVPAQTLALPPTIAPGLQLTYAFVDGRLLISTSPQGIEEVGAGESLADSGAYATATAGFPDESAALAYFDIRDSLAILEQVGLATDPRYVDLAQDLRTLESAAFSIASDDDVIATDATIAVGEREQEATQTLPGQG